MIRSAELVGKHVRVFAQQGAIRGVHDPCLIAAEGTYDLFSTGPGPTRPEYKWLDQGAVICSDRRKHWGDQFAADDRCSSGYGGRRLQPIQQLLQDEGIDRLDM